MSFLWKGRGLWAGAEGCERTGFKGLGVLQEQAAEESSGADTLIVGTALAPQVALAPQPAASSMQCSDTGSGDCALPCSCCPASKLYHGKC